MKRDPDTWCHTVSPFKTHMHSSSTRAPLYLHLNQTDRLPHPLCHPLPSYSSSLNSRVLPLLLQMGWAESWLRTFMPKTTCHPSLLLSRMVML